MRQRTVTILSASPFPAPRHVWRSGRPTGFTLTEILVVMMIIILVLAAAVPAFRALTGSRSTDAAQNLITAMVSRARTLALNDKTHPIGVFFNMDPVTGRTVMRLVQLNDSSLDDPDPYDQYKGWMSGVNYRQADNSVNPAIRADRVAFITIDNDVKKNDGVMGKPMVKLYRCIQSHNSNSGNAPPASGSVTFTNAYWEEYREGNLSLVPNTDPQVLPVGIGVQLISDPRSSNPASAVDRYVRTGVILFDSLGRLSYQRYTIAWDSPLGRVLHLDSNRRDLGTHSGSGARLYSSFGVVIYPQDELGGQATASNGDQSFAVPGLTGPASAADERAEEQWLDENTTPLLVNRYSGTIGVAQ